MTLIERKDPGLFRKIGDQIALKPDSYDQGTWAKVLAQEERTPTCDTVMCVAGQTAFTHPGFKRFDEDEENDTTLVVVVEGGEEEHYPVSQLAVDMLGLDEIEAGDLFSMFWNPSGDGPLHERVRDALYKMADGASASSVCE